MKRESEWERKWMSEYVIEWLSEWMSECGNGWLDNWVIEWFSAVWESMVCTCNHLVFTSLGIFVWVYFCPCVLICLWSPRKDLEVEAYVFSLRHTYTPGFTSCILYSRHRKWSYEYLRRVTCINTVGGIQY